MIKILFQNRNKNFYLLILLLVVGCTPLEGLRRIAGTSIAHLEKHRDHAISQHVNCQVSDCFQVILAIGTSEGNMPRLHVFQASARKGVVVFYGIPGQVDTTEAGVFIESEESGGSRIDVVSLSSIAQEKVAAVVFNDLKAKF